MSATDTNQHHILAHEMFYLKRRVEFLLRATAIADANAPMEWCDLLADFADVSSQEEFAHVLIERCGYKSVSFNACCDTSTNDASNVEEFEVVEVNADAIPTPLGDKGGFVR